MTIPAARHVRRMAAQVRALKPGEALPSPCNNVCRIDPDTQLCLGCLRTLDEVAAWGRLHEQGKGEVWRRLEARAAAILAPQCPLPDPPPQGEGERQR